LPALLLRDPNSDQLNSDKSNWDDATSDVPELLKPV
jgi:hypothetical protein